MKRVQFVDMTDIHIPNSVHDTFYDRLEVVNDACYKYYFDTLWYHDGQQADKDIFMKALVDAGVDITDPIGYCIIDTSW